MRHSNTSRSAAAWVAVGAITISLSTLAHGSARAADNEECITPAAEKAFECPAQAKRQRGGSVKRELSIKQPPPPMAKPKEPSPGAPEGVSTHERDQRAKNREIRSQQLLITEIQNLEALFEDTKANSPDRPKLARRIAESYVELESYALHDQTEADVAADAAAKRKDTRAAEDARGHSKTAKAVVEASRKSAIKYYKLLKDDYPNYCLVTNASDPKLSTGCGDEVLYYLAYEHEQGKDFEKARSVYLELIKSWPTSQYIPNAYFAFGELFFQEASEDPSKWSFAEQSYLEVIRYPPPGNKLFGAANYKLAYVYWNQGDYAKAISSFKAVVDYSNQYASLADAARLGASARRDLVPVYAQSGDPKKAYAFFDPLSGDSGGAHEKTFAMMNDLGLAYLDIGHYAEAIDVYTDLVARDRSERSCDYQGHITEAGLTLDSGDKESAKRRLDKQLETYKQFAKGGWSAPAVKRCGNTTAYLLSESAMSWHLEAVGGDVKGTGDKQTMKLAADVYEAVASSFTTEEFKSYEFPKIVKEDWPTIPKIRYLMADLLYFQKDWKRCGPAFDAVFESDPEGPDATESAFSAMLCYENMYAAEHAAGADRAGTGNLETSALSSTESTDAAKFAPRPLTDTQTGMVGAFTRYVCAVEPDASSPKEEITRYAEVKFARARLYFEARHFEEAAIGFRDVAMKYPNEEVGIYAGQLYLESINILHSHSAPARPACVDAMATDVPELTKLYCEGSGKGAHPEECKALGQVARDVERLHAERIFDRANTHPDTPQGIEEFRTAGQMYLDVWEKYGKAPCEANDAAACAKNDEILANAAESFQHARLVMKAVTVRKTLIDPKYHLDDTPLAKKAIYKIGANYQAIAVYDEAASWFERFAAESPTLDEAGTSASTALSDATVLRLGLGQEEKAVANADLFNKNYGSKKPVDTARVAFAIAAHFVEKEDWPSAKKRLDGSLSLIDKSAPLDVQIQAHAMMGRIHSRTGNGPSARTEYEKVRSMWSNPEDVVRRIEATDPSETEDAKLRRVERALTAVGEALFYFAEEKRAIADKIEFPRYTGSGERADVESFVKTKVADWIKRKRPAIDDAEKEYLKIVNLMPAAPPRWVIAAGSRVGQMKSKFVAQFRAAPIPKEWMGSGPSGIGDLTWEEIRGAYYDELDRASEPIKLEAKGAYQTCLKYSVDYRFFDDYSRTCEQWLSANYPSEYHLIDEFRSASDRVGSGLDERPQALLADQTPAL
ncbi:MAG: tetratricopeptide repeat protein [Polyangiaceae bacterium]